MQSTGRPTWIREWLAAALVGAGLLLLANLLVPPAAVPFAGHGARFAEMARAPLAFEGDFPQRILWPLLAWLVGFLGIGVVAFSQLCSAAFIAVVFWFARRRTGNWLDALLVTAAIAMSGAVLVYQPMACFSDQLNLLLMVLLVHFAARPAVFWPLVLLSALSHEMVFFFWPWLVYLRCHNGGVWWREGLLLVAVLLVYLIYRAPIASRYGVAYYLDMNFWVPWLLPALWLLWLLVVTVEFGPLLLLVGWGLGRDGALAAPDALGGRFGAWLYLAGIVPLMLLAYDVMRFATFAFLPVLLAAIAVLRAPRGRFLLGLLVVAAGITYVWLHPVPAEQGGRQFTAVAATVFFDLLPGRVPEHGPVALADALAITTGMLERWWPAFLVVALALAGSLVGGRLLRRAVTID